MNRELEKLTGTPVNASNGNLTRSDNEASRRGMGVDLGMGDFNPRKGANTKGKYVVDGVGGGGGRGPKRSSLRSAGDTR